MSLMVSELYDALREVGVSDDKACKAAEAVAQWDQCFGALEQKMTALEGRMSLLQWMVGTNIRTTLERQLRRYLTHATSRATTPRGLKQAQTLRAGVVREHVRRLLALESSGRASGVLLALTSAEWTA